MGERKESFTNASMTHKVCILAALDIGEWETLKNKEQVNKTAITETGDVIELIILPPFLSNSGVMLKEGEL